MKTPQEHFNGIVTFCEYARSLAGGSCDDTSDLWRRIELTLYNASRRILTELEHAGHQ